MVKSALPRNRERRTWRDRLLGRYTGGLPGPLVVCVGGVHGNEPSGVEAIQRVLSRLSEERTPFRGELVGLAGNLTALERGSRYIDEDLNRVWTLERIAALGDAGDGRERLDTVEAREQRELLEAMRSELAKADGGGTYCLDLHTTSSESVPFLTFNDTLRNRTFAGNFPLPLVLGLEEEVDGALLDYLHHLGHVTLAVEGGNHADPDSIEHLVAVLWLALVAAGCVELRHVPEAGGLRERLSEAVHGVPRIFELRYRHEIREGDEFRMKPGYRNFQDVDVGEPVARDRRGEVQTPIEGRLFLPLYQAKGDEGFFVVREVSPVWLKISAVLRRLRVDRLARLLPGVEAHPDREETLVVHPLLAGPLVVDLFHLLGYRRERPEDGRLVLSRRKEAVEGG